MQILMKSHWLVITYMKTMKDYWQLTWKLYAKLDKKIAYNIHGNYMQIWKITDKSDMFTVKVCAWSVYVYMVLDPLCCHMVTNMCIYLSFVALHVIWLLWLQNDIGWRAQSRKMLLFSTDAGFHFAGDGKVYMYKLYRHVWWKYKLSSREGGEVWKTFYRLRKYY